MTQKSASEELNALLNRLRIEQTIEDMQAEIDGRQSSTSNASVELAKARIMSDLEKFASGKPFGKAGNQDAPECKKMPLKIKSSVSEGDSILSRLPKILKNISGQFVGIRSGAFAKSETDRTKGRADHKNTDRVWQQDGMLLTLKSSGKRKLAVTLQIEGGAQRPPVQLSWLEDRLTEVDNENSIRIVSYALTPDVDGAYLVNVPSRAYVQRMRLIDKVLEGDLSNKLSIETILPFVEFVE